MTLRSFFGSDMTPETLARGMTATGCTQAVHLDMNAGHTGFEFYRVAPSGELPDLMRPLQGDWEAENSVPQIPAGSRIGALVSDSGVAIGVLDRGSASLSTVLMERWGRGSC